jgi:predicted transcriptional regulator
MLLLIYSKQKVFELTGLMLLTGKPHTTETQTKAREDILQHLRREPNSLIMIGPVSLWLRGGLSLEKTESLLDQLVAEGILREATSQELKREDARHGYYLTESGHEKLPPEDRSYGVIGS